MLFVVSCSAGTAVTIAPTASVETQFAATATPLPIPTALPSPTSTAAPAPSPTPMSAPSFRLIAYLASWSTAPSRGYRIVDIPADKLTHLNYAFAAVSPSGECVTGDASADARNFPELKLERNYPHLKTFISIGGAGAQNFPNATQNAEARQKFARSCIALMKQNGFDGMDVDWEFPKGNAEKENYAALLVELRAQLDLLGKADGTRYLLTIAAPAGPNQYTDVAWNSIVRDLDWIDLMTYDFARSWSSLTGLNAPLYASSSDPSKSQGSPSYNGHAAVLAYIAAGVPSDKIDFGVPFYGRGWYGVSNANKGLFQEFNGVPQGTRGGGTFDYRDLKNLQSPIQLPTQGGKHADSSTREPIAFHA
jgi:chitinase